eukprot:COSAG01_NODE_2664_length_7291_cov_4.395996_3_plen_51_part_00
MTQAEDTGVVQVCCEMMDYRYVCMHEETPRRAALVDVAFSFSTHTQETRV